MSEFIPADLAFEKEDAKKVTEALFSLGVFTALGISDDFKTIEIEMKIVSAIDLFKLKRFFELLLGRHYKYTKVTIRPNLLIAKLEAED